ncbi:ABC transporter ATP-binding protein [Burkholderiaceae bacterium FT117]|uniref:ABC transporter ATP-binding protein n=1 Tax=Zeimonas sediminis TaxID=2944268 RepID=UPI0023431188|nr:ABC transporter ATP-binding protein [Zeimonas sediminis]MCM5571076.1 ABC transporter ATP-binding protein [Zeimonas sediminis]
MLEIRNLQVFYDGVVEAVRDVSLSVPQGRIVALLGSNGAGKSTVLKTLSGVLFPEKGRATGGTLSFDGQDILHCAPHEVVRRGLVHVPEGRRLFDTLTVEENLMVGGATRPAAEARRELDRVLELFPQIVPHCRRVAGYLSGGQQQMVAIGRALMASPRLLLLDEPSLGLAPQIIDTIFDSIRRLRDDSGLTVLLVEQNAALALGLADYGYIMDRGRIALDGTPDRLLANADVQEFYLGVGSGGTRRRMQEVKHYKRRKRWLS